MPKIQARFAHFYTALTWIVLVWDKKNQHAIFLLEERVTRLMDEGHTTDLAFFGFSKALYVSLFFLLT